MGINDLGQIVEVYNVGINEFPYAFGFLYSNGNYSTLSYPEAAYTAALGINDSGEIVGLANGVIPEPSTWVMMLTGFAGLGLADCRRSRKGIGGERRGLINSTREARK
jgi:PEP-CTERM motif-containing protein